MTTFEKYMSDWFAGYEQRQAEQREKYPLGQGYDNLFNAEHRDLMTKQHGTTSASWVTIEELLLNQ